MVVHEKGHHMVTIIGIDCATDPKKVGIALGEFSGSRCSLVSAEAGTRHTALVDRIASWLPASGPAVIALDAPLGWPIALGDVLSSHRAGSAIGEDPHLLFRRETDRFVKRELGKQSLDVGADRIARTAHAALRLLEDVRRATGKPIPLAWRPAVPNGPVAIEVYPAGTLTACDVRAAGYKKRDDVDPRAEIIRGLGQHMRLPADTSPLLANADVLDAAVCVLAASDFLRGRAMAPEDQSQAEREGWIWIRCSSGADSPFDSGRS